MVTDAKSESDNREGRVLPNVSAAIIPHITAPVGEADAQLAAGGGYPYFGRREPILAR
jgi:hypothetical protein